jgi:hypothetical protein
VTVIMSESVDALVLDLLEWLDSAPRAYEEVMDAWRTSCPRLPVWEEANERGLVERQCEAAGDTVVRVTARGREFLARHRRGPARGPPGP